MQLRSIVTQRIMWQQDMYTDREVWDYLDVPREVYERWITGDISREELASQGYYDVGLHR